MTGSAPLASAAGYVHATAVVLGEAGVVIFGPSGSGKSALALALIEAAPPGRFVRLVGDDRVRLSSREGRLLVAGHPAIAGRIERRGHGIVTLPFEPSAVVRLVVELVVRVGATRLPDRLPPYRHGDAAVARLALAQRDPVPAQQASIRAALAAGGEI